jgi:hypothetical protein
MRLPTVNAEGVSDHPLSRIDQELTDLEQQATYRIQVVWKDD